MTVRLLAEPAAGAVTTSVPAVSDATRSISGGPAGEGRGVRRGAGASGSPWGASDEAAGGADGVATGASDEAVRVGEGDADADASGGVGWSWIGAPDGASDGAAGAASSVAVDP